MSKDRKPGDLAADKHAADKHAADKHAADKHAADKHAADKHAAVEFLVEPFVEGAPGPHVEAAVAAFTSRGVEVDVGPFASSATTDVDTMADAVAAMVRDALGAGATRLRIQVGADGAHPRVADLHSALDDIVREIERELGPADRWARAEKQTAVRLLSERGAFLLRGAVEDVAEIMGVSRITIYNYLNALEEPSRRHTV